MWKDWTKNWILYFGTEICCKEYKNSTEEQPKKKKRMNFTLASILTVSVLHDCEKSYPEHQIIHSCNSFSLRRKIRTLVFIHWKLKKVQTKNSWNQINQIFFREITFLAVLNIFLVQKLNFVHFSQCKKGPVF